MVFQLKIDNLNIKFLSRLFLIHLYDERMPFGSKFLRGHVNERDTDEQIDEGVLGALFQRSHIFAQRVFIRSRDQRVVSI